MTKQNTIIGETIKTEIDAKAFAKTLADARQEVKGVKDAVPFLGTDADLVAAYYQHKEVIRKAQLENERCGIAEPFNKKQLRLVSAGDLLDADAPSRKLMLGPWFKVGDAAMIYAPAGLGKSFLTLTIAMAVAGGGTIKGLNWKAEEATKVLYVDGEMPTPDLTERMKMILAGEWIEGLDLELMRENLSLFPRLGQHDDDGFIDLADEKHHKIVGNHAVKAGSKLVVFDNLSTLTDSMEDENNSVQFRKINAFISKLKRRDISCLVVHHANKEGFAYRGSSAIAVIYDSIIQLGRVEDSFGKPDADKGERGAEPDGEVTKFRISFEKSRAKKTPETASRVVTMGDFGYAIADGVEHDANLAKVVEVVKAGEHRGLSKRNAQSAFGLNPETIWKKVVIGLDRGLVRADEVEAMFSCPPADVKAAILRQMSEALETDEGLEF
ncbi:AAA family ATPase [Methylocystis echinoides]|uniref:AAA+ ATPase domain-containing protein n=1 Tax=Methylocystis echinoides TaxID=29468 RepID=A0A9W6GXZ2_9HYPH|nr:AAA family ATPase [Methylocystis echinoides]GLI94981.1 hypothetical protein LMG27198_39730 [Methylocystis echinoides]